ncbi:hypothetical protein [Dawidia soli]|uniref:Uncharacterized protein n=1 Tax=Dawidia soli TaxID=2782352 RepID=A0AAP2DGK9_9BACT|nr:hypothetical protein [Dawidia soli]MBT1688992.1 hypothetical protein [Dawidia soli]
MRVGLTLLFILNEKNAKIGVLKSYSLPIRTLRTVDVMLRAKEKANLEMKRNPDLSFLGINDVFTTSGTGEGSMLGRTTYFELNKKREALTLVLPVKSYPFGSSKITNVGWFNFRSIFFYNDPDEERHSFTFSVHSLVKASSLRKAKQRARVIVAQNAFKNRIVRGASDELVKKAIEFVGFQDFCPLFENPSKGGAYEVYYNRNIESARDLSRSILSKEELIRELKVVREVYRRK